MKRKSRVTADITKDAHDILRASCLKFDCSKGKLLEKMIRKFCGDVETIKSTETAVVKEKVKRFTPPMLECIYEYMKEKGVDDIGEANKFNDFYQSNGWKVGRNKMKCWKAAVRNWLKGYKNKTKSITKDEVDLDDRSWADPANFTIRDKHK